MAKIYTKNAWVDEILGGVERYNIKEDDGTPIETNVQLILNTNVAVAGTPVDAEKMNNIEDGIDGLDNLISVNLTEKNTETLTAPLILSDADAALQFLNPGGGSRDIELPAEGLNNHHFVIANTAETAETLTIKDDDGVVIGIVARGETKVYVSNAVNWRQLTTGGTGGGGADLSMIYALI